MSKRVPSPPVRIWVPGSSEPEDRRVLDRTGRTWKRQDDGSWQYVRSASQVSVHPDWESFLRERGPLISHSQQPAPYARAIGLILSGNPPIEK